MTPWYSTYLAELSLDPILGTKTQTFDFERWTLISKKGGFQLRNLLVHRPSAFPVPSPNLLLCSVAISEGEKRRHGCPHLDRGALAGESGSLASDLFCTPH